MKVGLLLSEHVRPGFRAVAGDYPDFFTRFFAEEPHIDFLTFDLSSDEFPTDLDGCDAWLISGSRRSVYEDEPWILRLAELVRRLDQERRKVVGICFGAQMIGHALGGEVARAPNGWQVGIKEVTVKAPQPWIIPPVDTFRILHSNADQILRLPDRIEVLGSSDGVPITMVAVEDHILGFQGHPEFPAAYAAVLMEARRGLISEELVDAGLASLANVPDTRLLSGWITRFMSE